ncbi:purine permease [Deinococcus sp. D7000]|uniref:NCS2 family nucleobase:cation symporter-2 n=1 Tax=Deinococcus radiopugnans ATCC 19172 TaxID=585398 RepID=A0A5C4Y8F7_9DEIO|nr:nucleobase:cation symporter-2 family protein [Deinococcus radiopugnans]MBB6016337.1 NCS2 family nucleobase:cation symporter-2 [Deinococcus radiopugnans ATCC 19172]QLG12250.1 purine permease [Deinococcus sp. D7000]TNM71303.1 purine permease [Deinococcus radiopugnans ATCC 19172]
MTTAPTRNNVHPVDEVLAPQNMIAFGLQHVLSMYAGIVAVPLVLASALGLDSETVVRIIGASFFMCGVATIIQTIGFAGFGAKLPIVQGTTFASVATMIAIGKSFGLPGIFGAVIAGGVLTVLLAPYFSKLLRFFPPVVAGTVILMIGVSLMPVAIKWAGGGTPGITPTFGAPINLGLATLTLVIVLLLTRFGKGFLSRVAVLLGLVIGTVVAALLGQADFSKVATAEWFGFTMPFHFGTPTFSLVPVLSMLLVMLVVMVETTADLLAIGEVTDKHVDAGDVAKGLRADGLSTALGGIFCAFPFTAFAQNVGLVRFTGIKSRFVVAVAGVILMLLGFLPKLSAVVSAIPLPVLGGAGLVLFGTVAAAGVQTLSKVNMNDTRNLIIVAVSVALGVIPSTVPTLYEKLPEQAQLFLDSGITSAALAAIILNILFNIVGNNTPHPSSLAPSSSNAPEPSDFHA